MESSDVSSGISVKLPFLLWLTTSVANSPPVNSSSLSVVDTLSTSSGLLIKVRLSSKGSDATSSTNVGDDKSSTTASSGESTSSPVVPLYASFIPPKVEFASLLMETTSSMPLAFSGSTPTGAASTTPLAQRTRTMERVHILPRRRIKAMVAFSAF